MSGWSPLTVIGQEQISGNKSFRDIDVSYIICDWLLLPNIWQILDCCHFSRKDYEMILSNKLLSVTQFNLNHFYPTNTNHITSAPDNLS